MGSKFRATIVLVAAFAVQVPAVMAPARAVTSSAALTGSWTAPFDVGTIGIHSILMRDGKVLLFERPEATIGSDARVWDPTTGILTDVSWLTARDVFCSGHSVLPDGTVLVTGGHHHGSTLKDGAPDTSLFDPATETWSAGPSLTQARWYPSSLEMADGKVLTLGGWGDVDVYADSLEVYDPVAGTMTTLPDSTHPEVALYPRMNLLPDGKMLFSGITHATWLYNNVDNTWKPAGRLNTGNRVGSNSVLLPGLTKVMVIGGGARYVSNTTEILDTTNVHGGWQYAAPMNHVRHWTNAVLLPDGTVLVVGGGLNSFYGHPQTIPEVYDPVANTWTDLAPQAGFRMYHSIALLLPDGRVFSAGQDLKNPDAYMGEVFSPPYMFMGPRPAIGPVDNQVSYGSSFTFGATTAAGTTVARIELIKPGSVTHATNFDQRFVDLAWVDNGDGTYTATAPPDGNSAPPGWYMLFITDSTGVPSVASWVHVSPATGPLASTKIGALLPQTAVAAAAVTPVNLVRLSGPTGAADSVAAFGFLPSLPGRRQKGLAPFVCHWPTTG